MPEMSPEKIVELRRLLSAATPGVLSYIPGMSYSLGEDDEEMGGSCDGFVAEDGFDNYDLRLSLAIGEWFAAISNAAPDLLSAAEELNRLRKFSTICAENESLRAELSDMESSFDLRHSADMRAIKGWREAHPGNELCQPDQADLCVWLMGELQIMEGVISSLRAENAALREDRDRLKASLCSALDMLTPSHRAPGCWCEHGQDIQAAGHSERCLAARAALKGDPHA